MASRLNLQTELEKVPGVKKVYFQPPESVKMEYPCIRYSLSAPSVKHADDRIYNCYNRYEITIIDKNPDSNMPEYLLYRLPRCRLDRNYVADNLNHFVFTLYF